jgi:hypothetical protein
MAMKAIRRASGNEKKTFHFPPRALFHSFTLPFSLKAKNQVRLNGGAWREGSERDLMALWLNFLYFFLCFVIIC